MSVINLFSASDFKAHCLELLDRIADRAVDRVTITKRGRVVGVLVPPDDDADAVRGLHGFMRGSVTMPANVDLTAPILDEAFTAADGILHG